MPLERVENAWFEAAGLIRLIEPECFKRLNAEAHAEAVQQMRRERATRRGTEFLLANSILAERRGYLAHAFYNSAFQALGPFIAQ